MPPCGATTGSQALQYGGGSVTLLRQELMLVIEVELLPLSQYRPVCRLPRGERTTPALSHCSSLRPGHSVKRHCAPLSSET